MTLCSTHTALSLVECHSTHALHLSPLDSTRENDLFFLAGLFQEVSAEQDEGRETGLRSQEAAPSAAATKAPRVCPHVAGSHLGAMGLLPVASLRPHVY